MSDGPITIPKDRWHYIKWWQALVPWLFGIRVNAWAKRVGALYRGNVYIWRSP